MKYFLSFITGFLFCTICLFSWIIYTQHLIFKHIDLGRPWPKTALIEFVLPENSKETLAYKLSGWYIGVAFSGRCSNSIRPFNVKESPGISEAFYNECDKFQKIINWLFKPVRIYNKRSLK